MLVNMKEMLEYAKEKNIAIGAFNSATLESARAAIKAAEELNLPFVLQHAPVHEEYIDFDLVADIMLSLAKNAKVPVCVHLDHGSNVDCIIRAIRAGFTSVMIDFSAMPYEENMAETARICKIAHSVGVTVEAELGNMPSNLKGDLSEYKPEDFYTVPEQAAEFAEKTGVDALAISFGTVHGVYKTKPQLNFDIIKKINKLTNGLPLVMHGGSGLTDDDYREAINSGIRKINYYTYEALAGGRSVYEIVKEKPEGLQFHDVATRAMYDMKDNLVHVMKLFAGIE